MSFNYNRGGGTWRTARALDTLAGEIAAKFPDLTCLGTIGDLAHQSQDTYSDHNPVVKDPVTGQGIVRAVDVGGNPAELKLLETHLNALYNAGDPRLKNFGYTHMNGLVTVWDDNPGTALHSDPGDDGHLHISLTQATYPSTPGGYVPAIDSTVSWQVANIGTPLAPPAPAPVVVPVAWPALIPRSEYFGLITGPDASHGGYVVAERPYVRLIQQQLVRKGFVPGHSNPGDGWSDGIFEKPTADAVERFQRRWMPGTKFYGQVWSDDWARLFSL